MADIIKNGKTVRLLTKIYDSIPVGSIATVLFTDEQDNVYIEWAKNGGVTSFSRRQFMALFEPINVSECFTDN